jgi:putative ABC transport system permease protein
MIITDFKIAFRNIRRNKVSSAISILGLGIGLASIILLQALITHETSFDKFIPGYKNVYRMTFGSSCITHYPLGEEMKKDFPEVKDFFRINQLSDFIFRNSDNEMVREHHFAFSDPSIFKILGIKMIAGLPASSPTEVAISENIAKKYFNKTSPLGATLKMKWFNDFINLTITGVYKDFPANSSLGPEFLTDLKLYENMYAAYLRNAYGEYAKNIVVSLDWNIQAFYTYVVLEKNADKQSLASKIQKYTQFLSDPKSKELKYSLQPVSEVYLRSGAFGTGYTFTRTGNPNELKYYWAISFMILLISVTNYIFLTRASTSDRLRELGTRKVLGASQNSISRQIILESTLITLISLIPASFLIDPGMSFINSTLNRTLSNEVFSSPWLWLSLILAIISIGTISGLSIGLNVSKKPAILLLNGKTSEKSRSGNWDYSFLVFHFSLYIILIVSVLTVTKQIRFSQTDIKGINPKNIITLGLYSDALKSGFPSIRSEMEKIPGVIKVAGSTDIAPMYNVSPLTMAAKEGGEKITFDGLIFGEGMTEVLGLEIIEGSSFDEWKPVTDVIFNESGAKKYNIKVGDKFMGAFNVKGIVKDFNAHSLHTLIQPMIIIQQNPAKFAQMAIKTDGTNDIAIIKRLGELYKQIDPTEIYGPRYLTENISDFYGNDKSQGKLVAAFSFLAAILAVMGLFGIALISIVRKTKEIGLRKVNGASIFEVAYLLNRDFARWVIASIIMGIPVSIYIMTVWQKRFAYKTELSLWIFLVAGMSAILIALLTVSWQSWRAATRNPVEALRYE